MAFDNIKLEKGMYHEGNKPFTQVLEELDPSENYKGTALEGTDGLTVFAGEAQSGVLSVRADGMDCEELATALSARGVCVRAGLHCAPRAHMSAGTLKTGTVRFSFSPFVTDGQVDEAAGILKDILNSNRH